MSAGIEQMAYFGDTPWHEMGVSINDDEQLMLFPSCNVYVAGRGLINEVHVYSLEIISPAYS